MLRKNTKSKKKKGVVQPNPEQAVGDIVSGLGVLNLTPELLKDIAKCQGFVMHISVLTPELDANKNKVIREYYQRSKFPKNDLPNAVRSFKEYCSRDMWGELKTK